MTKKLYECELRIYVVAENEAEAHHIAHDSARNEDADSWDVYETDSVAHTWSDLLPYGGNDDKMTCSKWLEQGKKVVIHLTGDMQGHLYCVTEVSDDRSKS